MPSSPDQVLPLVLPRLRPAQGSSDRSADGPSHPGSDERATIAQPLPQFHPTVRMPTHPPVFELAAEHRVPEAALAEARTAAQAQGYAEGWAAGVREARAGMRADRAAANTEYRQVAADRRARTVRAIEALDLAAGRLEQRALQTAEQMETAIIESAFTIAEAIVATTLRNDDMRGAAALRRALSLAPAGESVTVVVSPDDYAVLTANGAVQVTEHAGAAGRTVELVADESLQPGDAVAHWNATTVDARLSTGLERVRAVLNQGVLER